MLLDSASAVACQQQTPAYSSVRRIDHLLFYSFARSGFLAKVCIELTFYVLANEHRRLKCFGLFSLFF